MFRNIRLVALRDFLAVVRTKGFLIGLVFLPGVIMASIAVPKLAERFAERGVRRFAVADFTGRVAPELARAVAARNAEPDRKLTLELVPVDLAAKGIAPTAFAAAKQALGEELAARARGENPELFGFVLIGPKVADVPPPEPDLAAQEDAGVVYGARSLTAGDMNRVIRDALREATRKLRLEQAGVDPAVVARVDQPAPVAEQLIGKNAGEVVASSGKSEAMGAIGAVMLMMMGVMQSAGMLLNSTIEEKSNRVVEVLVSSIRPFELLAGKILGAWLTGLVVLVAWGGAGIFAAGHFELLRPGLVSGANLVWFAYFFLAGYLLFASLYAAVGAMCSSIQDAQSLMFPIVILIMIPMLSLSPVIEHPDGGLAKFLTFFPFSAPFIAVLRLTLSPPAPQWQIALAALSVAIGACGLVWLGGKVFRIAIFSTGKPPRPAEIWRWIKEA